MSDASTRWNWFLKIASCCGFGFAVSQTLVFWCNCAFAQSNIVPDNTLGGESSVVTPNVDVNGITSDRISGGAIRGANLFHSFQQFNIDEGRGAYFTNPTGIENILSRVTGGNASNILGKLGVLGNANLFLINPSGIIFGRNASLDVRGSFVGTTANAIGFGNQGFFSATNPNNPELLTVNPSAFLFNQIAAAPIQNNSVAPAGLSPSGFDTFGLRVPDGRSLLLVSGNVSMDGGRLNAFGGRVELGGLAEAGTVGLNVDGSLLSLSFPDAVAWADVFLSNASRVDVRAGGGGSIAINARFLDISGESLLLAGIGRGLGTASSQAGDITLNVTEAIKVRQFSIITNIVYPNGTGNSGNLLITAGSLFLTDGSQLGAATTGQGNAGNVNITARDTVSFDGVVGEGENEFTSAALSIVQSGGVGKAGDINITTGSLVLTNGGEITTSNRGGQGSAGNVNIIARDTVSFNGITKYGYPSGVLSYAGSPEGLEVVGSGGQINITTGSLTVTNGGRLSAVTGGQGDAGSIVIVARNTVSFDGVSRGGRGLSSAAGTIVELEGVGKGGDINITTGSLALTNGAFLSVGTNGQGDGGNIIVNANTLETVNGGQVLATSRSTGKAGNITLNVTDSVTFSGKDVTYFDRLAIYDEYAVIGADPASGLFANTSKNSSGKGGDLRITTGQLNVQDGAQVSVSSEGLGDAGNLNVKAGSIFLNNQGKLQASTASGEGGNINLRVRDLILMRRQSQISAEAGNNGNGGNIRINAPDGFIVAVPSENSDIIANAFRGRGGNINITSSGIYGLVKYRPELPPEISDINASSQFGINGTVEINTPDVDPNRGLINLPAAPLETEVSQVCQPRTVQNQSSFTITGRGGLPPNPRTEPLSSDAVQVDWVTLKPRTENRASTNVSDLTSPTVTIVEAQGWGRNPKGQIVLTANAPTPTPHSSWQTPIKCHGF